MIDRAPAYAVREEQNVLGGSRNRMWTFLDLRGHVRGAENRSVIPRVTNDVRGVSEDQAQTAASRAALKRAMPRGRSAPGGRIGAQRQHFGQAAETRQQMTGQTRFTSARGCWRKEDLES